MAKDLERIQLSPSEEDLVVGGFICYRSVNGGDHYLYSRNDRSKKYGFNYDNMAQIDQFCNNQSDLGVSDEDQIQMLIAQGLCWPL